MIGLSGFSKRTSSSITEGIARSQHFDVPVKLGAQAATTVTWQYQPSSSLVAKTFVCLPAEKETVTSRDMVFVYDAVIIGLGLRDYGLSPAPGIIATYACLPGDKALGVSPWEGHCYPEAFKKLQASYRHKYLAGQ